MIKTWYFLTALVFVVVTDFIVLYVFPSEQFCPVITHRVEGEVTTDFIIVHVMALDVSYSYSN